MYTNVHTIFDRLFIKAKLGEHGYSLLGGGGDKLRDKQKMILGGRAGKDNIERERGSPLSGWYSPYVKY